MVDPDLKAWGLPDHPHRRFNALTGEWVLVSPQRTQRPWQGQREPGAQSARPAYDPDCYLCPGNRRAGGAINARYPSTYVFANDYPALLPGSNSAAANRADLLLATAQAGECRVLSYSPRHDLTMADMNVAQIGAVIDLWAAQVTELQARWSWVQVFENKGEAMGCSNPHPHGQIWASDFIPELPARELERQRQWFAARGSPLLLDYATLEAAAAQRVVLENTHWIALVPWWALWPFETIVLPRRAVHSLPALSGAERAGLAELLSRLLRAYDRLFKVSFPYSFGWHGGAGGTDASGEQQGVQLHAHCYPPLLRSASVRKFMVGYELLAEPQRDVLPEVAAQRLRECVA